MARSMPTEAVAHLPEGIVHLGEESWATVESARKLLEQGVTVSLIGIGTSMEPMIPDGTRMILEPVKRNYKPKKGEVVLARIPYLVEDAETKEHVKVYGYVMHLIYLVRFDGQKVLIGDNHGNINGWALKKDIFGVYVGAIE
jgi:hypothetical protein